MTAEIVLLVHAAAAWFMTGLIWVVQAVHYPLFAGIGADGYAAYQRSHMSRITFIVAPAMLIETLATVGVVLLVGGGLAWLAAGLLAGIWASTFLLQVPLHGRLTLGFDADAHRRLVVTNWIRTVLWSARGVVSILLLLPLLEPIGKQVL